MQERKVLSLRDILSAAEAVSQEEMDELVDSEIEEGEEFLCDLPEELIQLFYLSKKYYLQTRQIMEHHSLRHEKGEIHGTEECEDAHMRALQAAQQVNPIREIFWILASSYAGVSQEYLGIRKGGMLVGLPEEEDRDLLLIGSPEIGEVSMKDFLGAIFGEESE